jgi:hypothetical protein
VRYSFHDVALDSEIPLPEVRRAKPVAPVPSIGISLARAAFGGHIDWFRTWKVPADRLARGRPWLSFGRQDDGYVLRFHNLADFHVSAAGDLVRCLPVDGCPRVTLRHLLLDQVLPLVLSQRGSLVVHASAVHLDGFGTIAFAGPAGSGKSTLAAALALRGCSVVADDSLVVAGDSEVLMAIPGYPGSRLWQDSVRRLGLRRDARTPVAHYTVKQRVGAASLRFHDAPSPLRAIFVVGRRSSSGAPARARTLGRRDRVMALAPFTCVMDVEDRRQLSEMFAGLSALATRVPVARLHVSDGRRPLVHSADEIVSLAQRAAVPVR